MKKKWNGFQNVPSNVLTIAEMKIISQKKENIGKTGIQLLMREKQLQNIKNIILKTWKIKGIQ